MMAEETQVYLTVRVPEYIRDALNSFVVWLNINHPKRKEQQKRIDWNQHTAMTIILENSCLWHEFLSEDWLTVHKRIRAGDEDE